MPITLRVCAYCVLLATVLPGAIKFSDTKLSPAKGKQGQTFPFVLYSANCQAQGDKPTETLDAATLDPTGADLEIKLDQPSKDHCSRQGTIKIHDDASPGDVQLIFRVKPDVASMLIPFTVLDKNAGPVPPGITPRVDVEWDVLDYSVTRDNFGKRVAENFYAIQVVIGNDSGYALQIASVGFVPRSLSTLQFLQKTLPNSSYVIARGVLEEGQILSARNTVDRYLQGTAILLAGFTPFFKNTGHRSTYAAAVAVFANPLLQSFEKIYPDKTITELKRIDDFTLRDGVIVANNTQMRTVVFFQKNLVKGMVALSKEQLKAGLNVGPGNLTRVTTILDEVVARSSDESTKSIARTARNVAGRAAVNQAAQGDLQSRIESILQSLKQEPRLLGEADTLELQVANLRLLRLVNASINNIDKLIEPLLVRWELNNLVLVGDQIAYVNRVRVDSAAPLVGVAPPLTVDEITTPASVSNDGKKTSLTITGEHLTGATVTLADSSAPITLEPGQTDVNGKFITVFVTVKSDFTQPSFTLNISAPGLGGAKSVRIGVTSSSDPVIKDIKPDPDPLPQAGGKVKVTGQNLKGVQVFIDTVKLDTTDAADGITVTVPKQPGTEITLTFKSADGTKVLKTQKLTLAPPAG